MAPVLPVVPAGRALPPGTFPLLPISEGGRNNVEISHAGPSFGHLSGSFLTYRGFLPVRLVPCPPRR